MPVAERRLLSEPELREALGRLPGWSVEGGRLVKTFAMPAFLQGIELVRRVAQVAEEMNHHPDIHIQYRRVRFELSTHDLRGISHLDVELAHRIEAEAAALAPPAGASR